MKVAIGPGGRSRFDVMVGDEIVASKEKVGILTKIFGDGGFPDDAEAVAAVRAKLAQKKG